MLNRAADKLIDTIYNSKEEVLKKCILDCFGYMPESHVLKNKCSLITTNEEEKYFINNKLVVKFFKPFLKSDKNKINVNLRYKLYL